MVTPIEFSVPTLEQLSTLIKLTDRFIGEIEDSMFRYEPINWADLCCVEAGVSVGAEGEPEVYVLIEEASPSCPDFQAHIRERLHSAAWDVSVRTEW